MSEEDSNIEVSDSSPVSVSSNDQELIHTAADESSEFKQSHGDAESPMNVEREDVVDDKVPQQPRGPRTPPDSPPDENEEVSVENAGTSPDLPITNVDVNKPPRGPRTPPNSPPPEYSVAGPSRKGPRTPPNSPPRIDTSEEIEAHFLPENSPYYGIDSNYYLSIPEHRPALEIALNRLQLIRRFTRKIRDIADLSVYLPVTMTFRAPRLTYEEFIRIVPNQTPEHFFLFNEDLERIDRAAENFRRLMMPPPSPRGDIGMQNLSCKKNSKTLYAKKSTKSQPTSDTEQSEPQVVQGTSGTKSVTEVVEEVKTSSDEISVVYEGPTNGTKADKLIEIVLDDSSNSSPESQNVDESIEDGKHVVASTVKDADLEVTPDEDKDDGYISSAHHENIVRARDSSLSKEDLKRRYNSNSPDEDPKRKYIQSSASEDSEHFYSSASTQEDPNKIHLPESSDKHENLTDTDKNIQTENPLLGREPVDVTNLELKEKDDFKEMRSLSESSRISAAEPIENTLLKSILLSSESSAICSESVLPTPLLDYSIKLKHFENFTDDEDSKSPHNYAERSPMSEQISSKNSESESCTIETDSSSRQSENDETVAELELSTSYPASKGIVKDNETVTAEESSKDSESISFQTLGSVKPVKHRNKDVQTDQKDEEDSESVSPRKRSRKTDDDVTGKG